MSINLYWDDHIFQDSAIDKILDGMESNTWLQLVWSVHNYLHTFKKYQFEWDIMHKQNQNLVYNEFLHPSLFKNAVL